MKTIDLNLEEILMLTTIIEREQAIVAEFAAEFAKVTKDMGEQEEFIFNYYLERWIELKILKDRITSEDE